MLVLSDPADYSLLMKDKNSIGIDRDKAITPRAIKNGANLLFSVTSSNINRF